MLEEFYISSIRIPPDRLRGSAPDPKTVQALADSIEKIGLQNPPIVWVNEIGDEVVLVAGCNRLAALKKLGVEKVQCRMLDDVPAAECRLHEIAENLHRAELTAVERDAHIAEWIRLTEEAEPAEEPEAEPDKSGSSPGISSQLATKKKGPGRPQSGVNKAAKALGISKDAAHRAVKTASLSKEAKAEAKKLGLDDNQSALLAAAKESEPAKQVQVLQEKAKSNSKASAKAKQPTKTQLAHKGKKKATRKPIAKSKEQLAAEEQERKWRTIMFLESAYDVCGDLKLLQPLKGALYCCYQEAIQITGCEPSEYYLETPNLSLRDHVHMLCAINANFLSAVYTHKPLLPMEESEAMSEDARQEFFKECDSIIESISRLRTRVESGEWPR